MDKEVEMNFLPIHDKLAEASFFLRYLTHEQEKTTLQDREDAFRFYLSAFLNAAYSVDQYLTRSAKVALQVCGAKKQESGKQAKGKYDKWKDEWIKSLSTADKNVWKHMEDSRGGEVHLLRVTTLAEPTAVPTDGYSTRNPYYYGFVHRSHFIAAIHAGGDGVDSLTEEKRKLGLPGWCNAWTNVNKHYIFISGEKVGITDVCKKYYELLQNLVAYIERCVFDTTGPFQEASRPPGNV
jgi:hypothetical protein